MGSPNKSLATLRPELGSFMDFDLAASRLGFIGAGVLRVFNVVKQSGTFGRFKKEHLIQTRDTKRAPGSGYARQRHEFTDHSFATVEHGAEEPVDDREAEMYADYFDAESVSAERARDVVARNYEIRVANAVQDTNVWTPTAAAASWTDPVNAKPIDDVEAQVQALYDKGIRANALIVSWKTYRDLRNTNQVIDRVNSAGAGDRTTPSDVTIAMLQDVFDLENILVGDAQWNNNLEGQTADTLAPIWSKTLANVCRVADSGDIREPCLGRTFHWSADGSQMGGVVESYRDETVRGDIIRSRMDTDENVIYPEANELIDIT